MVEFSHEFAQHRLWEMREGLEPSWVPPEAKWEAVLLCYTDENRHPIERPVWVRPIANGKVPMGAWVFDVKVQGVTEGKNAYRAELRRDGATVRAPAPEAKAPITYQACPFCLSVLPAADLVQTTLVYQGGHETQRASFLLGRTLGCSVCRQARGFPVTGYMVPVVAKENGIIDKTQIITSLWAELQRLEEAK